MSVLTRVTYLLSTYSGARVVLNRARHAGLPGTQTAALDGGSVRVGERTLLLRVHSRRTPRLLPRGCRAGMVSIKLAAPGIPHGLYTLLCATGHFGCGHLEVAFYEESGRVVVHGVRNILRANVERLRPGGLDGADALGRPVDPALLLAALARLLEPYNLRLALAAPADCIALSVDERLIPLEKRASTLAALGRRYERSWSKVSRHDPHVRVQPPLHRGVAAPSTSRPRLRRRVGLAAAAQHPAISLVLFFSLALHMHGRFGQWPSAIGTRGFPEALVVHANLAAYAWGSLLLGCLAAGLGLPSVGLVLRGPRARRVLRYVAVYTVLGMASLGVTQLAPGPFLAWWWD